MRYSFAALLSLAYIGVSFSFSRLGLNRNSIVRNQVLYSTPEVPNPAAAEPSAPATKGFGAAKVKVDPAVAAEAEKDAGTKTYDIQAKRGVPEYNIFLRPVNGTEVEWVPVGSMVRQATIFSNMFHFLSSFYQP